MTRPSLSRRDVLRLGGAGALVLAGARCSRNDEGPQSAVSLPPRVLPTGEPDVEIALRAVAAEVPILPGPATRVWRFEGSVVKGEATVLEALPGSHLGPTIRVRRGQRLRVRFTNQLPEESIVHWHGLDVSWDNDGGPALAVPAGGSYFYDFPVTNRAGTYWYHPHPHHKTAGQVMNGLAGLFLVSDDDERAVGLPTGAQDLPLVIQDRIFDANNQLVYAPDHMVGFLGDRILVNGKPSPTLTVKAGTYRLRLLNGSNSRVYKLAWGDGRSMVVIGTDGGLLEAPVERPYVMLAPGERVEVFAELTAPVSLESTSFSGVAPSHGGGGLANGAAFNVCRFAIDGAGATTARPARLVTMSRHGEAVNENSPRVFATSMQHMEWRLNGRTFAMLQVADNERVRLHQTEVWEFSNPAQNMMSMAHPLHVHGPQFMVVSRRPDPSFSAGYDSVRQGFVDEGWKDTVLVMPGERVRLRVRFDNHAGLFLYHCHNLEHEDMGMMRHFLVE